MEKFKLIKSIMCVLLLSAFVSANNMSATTAKLSPTATVKAANTAIYSAVKKAGSSAEAISMVKTVLEKYCDFTTMSKMVTSSFSTQLSSSQMETFNSTFIDLLKAANASKLKGYSSADKVVYNGETIEGTTATVKTLVKTKQDNAKINYTMRLIKNNWYVVNYIVEDINTVDNYKKQFKRLFKKNSFDTVMSNLKKRTAKFNSGN